MAEIRPFRALSFDPAVAGPLAALIAPPYDVIDVDERSDYRSRSPYNIVNLTLPDDESQSGPLLTGWRERGVMRLDGAPALWWLEQSYTGPDGRARTREGFLASIKVEPYEAEVVLPHERTHAAPKESRLRLLASTRTQLEPIFLLYDDPERCEQALRREAASRPPDLEVEEVGVLNRLWRVDGEEAIELVRRSLVDKQLLIADGHHRYETALAFHQEDGSPSTAYTFAALVNTRGEGLAIFPTHRLFETAPAQLSSALGGGEPKEDLEAALAELETLPYETASVLVYDRSGARLVRTSEPILDVELVDRLGHEGISYSADWREAAAEVDSGAKEVAVLMRPPKIEQVFAAAREGRVMPQKSTYFYPKLLSGLVLHPL